MANIVETPEWEVGIYQIETTDEVIGGAGGISNIQGQQLANRTAYLKAEIEGVGDGLAAHEAAADPHTQYAPKESPIFTGGPEAPTPAQFDATAKLATMQAVQRALGNYQGGISTVVGGTLTLTAADAGKQIVLSGVSVTGNLVLPLLAAVPDGASFLVRCEAATSNWTISSNAADVNKIVLADGPASSVPIKRGHYVLIVRTTNAWRIHGTLDYGKSEDFAALNTAAGYQVLPSGIIFQWGSVAAIAATSNKTVTLPMTFPDAAINAVASFSNFSVDASPQYTCQVRAISASEITIRNLGASTNTFGFIIIGR